MALQYDKWIQMAEEKNLFLTVDSYKQLTKDKEYKMVEIDYLNFLYQEEPKKYNPCKVYKARNVYAELIHFIKPTHIITFENTSVVKECDSCEGIKYQKDLVTNYGLKCPDLGWDFYTVGDSNILTTGSGDGHTRWMLWKNVKKMPDIYYRVSSGPK